MEVDAAGVGGPEQVTGGVLGHRDPEVTAEPPVDEAQVGIV